MTTTTTVSGTALVVEDLKINRTLLHRTLASLGYRVVEAADGAEAIELIENTPFDIIFLDWELPGLLKGDHVARHLHTLPDHASTLIIAITGDTSPPMLQRCAAAGTHAFLGKALDPASVGSALAEARLQQSAHARHPASVRIQKALTAYSDAFPGGLAGVYHHCRDAMTSEHDLLCAAVASADWGDAARAAHNLVALGAMTGIPELQQAARVTETALRRGEQALIPHALTQTRLAINHAREALSVPPA